MKTLLALVAGLSVVGAAAPEARADEPTGRVAEPIVGGLASDATQNAVVMLVHILSPPGTPPAMVVGTVCSATLLGPTLLLTARHCLSQTSQMPYLCDQSGIGSAGGAIGPDFTPSDVHIYLGLTRPNDPFNDPPSASGKTIFHDDGTNLCNHDVALLELDTPLNAPYMHLHLDGDVTQGESLTLVGWGITLDNTIPAVRQQRAGVLVGFVGPAFDFMTSIQVPDGEFETKEGICDGDSGGPAFDTMTGAVVGIVSQGGNGISPPQNDPSAACKNATNYFSRVAAFKDTITNAAAMTGTTLLTDTPAPAAPKGCSCSAVGHREPNGPLLGALAVALTALRRRRREALLRCA